MGIEIENRPAPQLGNPGGLLIVSDFPVGLNDAGPTHRAGASKWGQRASGLEHGPYDFKSSRWRKHGVMWSFTKPAACMKA